MTHSHERAQRGSSVSKRLASYGDRLIESKQPFSGYAVEAAAVVASIVEGAGHVIGVTGRAFARSLRPSRSH